MNRRAPHASLIASRPGLVVAMAVVAGALLLAGAFAWKGDSARRSRPSRIVDAVDVVTPAPLSEEETKRTTRGLDQDRVALDAGAWVQVADEKGRLQQRYRATRIDPEPDRWVRMEQPHAVLYPGPDRVITMRADRGRARIPKQALQAGRLDGHVEIRAYRAAPGEPIRFDGDEPVGEPVVVIQAEEAQFDEVLGEIRCDRAVTLTAQQISNADGKSERTTVVFKGEGLSISVDSQMRTIERLVVERSLVPIVITREGVRDGHGARAGAAGETGGAPAPATDPARADDGAVATTGAGSSTAAPASTGAAGPAGAPDATTASAAPAQAPVDGASKGAATASAAPATPATPASAADFRPYRLTLHDNVVVRRINQGRESVVRGDRLVALFAMESQGLRKAMALGDPAPTSAPAPSAETASTESSEAILAGALEWWNAPMPARLSLLALAAPGPQAGSSAASPATPPSPASSPATPPSPASTPAPAATDAASTDPGVDLITISYDGRLVMVPAQEQRAALKSQDDVVLSVEAEDVGTRRFVEVEDVRTLSRARCERLVYQAATDVVDLEGSVRQPLQLRSPQLDLEGGAFRFHRPSGKGEVGGSGRMRLGEAGRERGAQAAASTGATPPAPGGSDRAPASITPRDLEIVWAKGLDIELGDERSGGRLRSAHFMGDVKVDGTDFALATQGLRVYFAEKGENVVERIRAEGHSVASRLADAGKLEAQVIDVALTQDPQGRTIPVVMEARGNVTAADRNQTMWSDDLRVTFKPRAPGADGDSGEGSSLVNDKDLGNVEIEKVLAGTLPELDRGGAAGTPAVGAVPRGVQLLLKDGARVFASRLDGDATRRQVELLGPDVMIVQKNLVADQLTHLLIDEGARTITANGPGRFRYFRQPVTDATPTPRDRPDPKGPLSLDATWGERMKYDDSGNGGGGSIDLVGGVRVRATRSDREFSALDADKVQLDLRRDAEGGAGTRTAAPRGATAADGAGADGGFGGGVRRIQRLIARDNARLESQTWATAERVGEPRLFRVTGDHVEYDTISGEALVAGPGTLLAHDVGTPGAAERAGGVDARGSSRFKWTTSMDMKRLGAQRYLVTMKDGVEVLHAGVRPDDTLTLTCDQLETTLLRPGVGEEGGAGRGVPVAANPADGGVVDLGSAAELLRVRGLGRVMVRAPDADIECDEFDYDIRTQIAQIKGRDGRLAKVLRSGTGPPISAASVLWDRQTGRITVQSGSGAVGR